MNDRMERVAGTVILLWGWRRALAAFLAGALAVLAHAPYDFFAVCFVSFPVLVWLIDGSTGDAAGRLGRLRPAFAIGWWFGFGYFAAGLWWIGNALLVEADSFAWALPLAVLVLPALLAVFYGFATALARLFWTGSVNRIMALAFGFGVAEWLRATLFTGFPWNAIGYAAMPSPLLMQSASVVGLFGMNALAVLVFAMPAVLAQRQGRKAGLALAAVVAAAHVGFGAIRLDIAGREGAAVRTLAIRLVQPSIAQSAKWSATERDRIFSTYLALTKSEPRDGAAKPAVIVWPETAVPFILTDRPDALAALGEALDDGQTLFAGAVRAEGDQSTGGVRYTNSAVVINDAGEIVDAADKLHLVPFGEYLPFAETLERLGIDKVVDTPVAFSSGQSRRIIEAGGAAILPLICYEIIFPDEIADAARMSDVILNVTNDAWYGATAGPYQHFRQAQIRAVETARPVARAANNGISAVIDAYGRVVDGLALDAVGVLDANIRLDRPVLVAPGNPSATGLGVIALFFVALVWAQCRRWLAQR